MLVLTSGEPLGVNAELMGQVLAAVPDAAARARGLVVVGSAWQWRDQIARLGGAWLGRQAMAAVLERPVRSLAEARPGEAAFLDVGTPADAAPAETLPAAVRGAVAVRALEALRGYEPPPGERLAVVTGPIDKHTCHSAGFAHPGQTEFFEALWGAPAVMTLAGPRLRVGLATNHLALAAVPGALTQALVVQKLVLLVRTLRRSFGVAAPRVAVCGLNPHAGDGGLFGDEEAEVIAPAIVQARTLLAADAASCELFGPLPADTVFHRAYNGGFDGVLAMYHDQGLGPLKTVHFDDGVNLSGGLPHLRVSPDHGPAADLFLQRRASPASWSYALRVALDHLDRHGPGGAR